MEKERQKALDEQRIKEERIQKDRQKEAAKRAAFENVAIYFDFDQSTLTPEAQGILKAKAEFMRMNPGIKVTIEGHADERGTNEYNLALGDRRANSAKGFLISLGVSNARLNTISYGEEKPIVSGQTEAAWGKNRRCNFSIH